MRIGEGEIQKVELENRNSEIRAPKISEIPRLPRRVPLRETKEG
jgi:hypothetical protein